MIGTILVNDLKQRKCSLLWHLETCEYDFQSVTVGSEWSCHDKASNGRKLTISWVLGSERISFCHLPHGSKRVSDLMPQQRLKIKVTWKELFFFLSLARNEQSIKSSNQRRCGGRWEEEKKNEMKVIMKKKRIIDYESPHQVKKHYNIQSKY